MRPGTERQDTTTEESTMEKDDLKLAARKISYLERRVSELEAELARHRQVSPGNPEPADMICDKGF